MTTEPAAPAPDFNFARSVLASAAIHPLKVAYIDDAGTLTYSQLADGIRRFAHALRGLGLKDQQRVLLLAYDCNDWPVAFLGALHAGLVPVPLNTSLTGDDLAYILQHSGVSAAIVSRALLPTYQSARVQTAEHDCNFTILMGGKTTDAYSDFSALVAQGDGQYQGAATKADAVAFWLYSSGSTGRPKGVLHTHANLYWTSELYAKRTLGLRSDDIVYSAAKLFFAYGLGNALTFPLTAGATTILMSGRPTPEAVFTCLQQHRPTIFCAAPTLFAGMLASTALPTRASCALRLCTSAGEPLPRQVGERFSTHFGAPILDGLGSTEMLHIFVSNRPENVSYGSTGKPVEGYEIELRDDEGHTVTPGEIGDLWARGPSRALSYWNDESRSRQAFVGPWLRTGDKYTQREDGCMIYAGRNDDMLKISGQYVSPFEVESTLAQHAGVLECAVVGSLDDFGITKSKAYVVLRNDTDPAIGLAEELKLFVKTRLAPFKRPHHIVFVKTLPKTETGKILRSALRNLPRNQ